MIKEAPCEVDEGVYGLPGCQVAAIVEKNVIGVAHSILLSSKSTTPHQSLMSNMQ